MISAPNLKMPTVPVTQYYTPYQNTWEETGPQGGTSSLTTIHETPTYLCDTNHMPIDNSTQLPYCHPLISKGTDFQELGNPQFLYPHRNPLERLQTHRIMFSGTHTAAGESAKTSNYLNNSKREHEGKNRIGYLVTSDAEADDATL